LNSLNQYGDSNFGNKKHHLKSSGERERWSEKKKDTGRNRRKKKIVMIIYRKEGERESGFWLLHSEIIMRAWLLFPG
jgi:hypothetical protein